MTHLTRHRRPAAAPITAPAPDVPPTTATAAITSEYPKTGVPESFAVFDAMSDIVCITTLDGTLRFLNRAGRDLLGYTSADEALVGCLFPTHTPAARKLLLDEVIPAALLRGETTGDTTLQTADGRVFPAAQTVFVTPDGVGQPLSLTIVIRNVSIERQSAARLNESQRLFEMIARNSPDFLYLYDPRDERIVWTNRCPHAFLGGPERDARTISRRELLRFVHPDDRDTFRTSGARMAAAYGDSDVLSSEYRVRTPGGNWRWVHTRASVFSRRETGAPLLLLGIATDISQRRKSEAQLRIARDAAEAANGVKNEFLARIGVEFRSSLHAIVGLATEVRANRDRRLTARELEQLDALLGQGTQLLTTIADLHDYTRVESGELRVSQELVDVRDTIRETVAAFADHPGQGQVPLVVHLPEMATPLLTDPRRLRQALSHLVGNALAFTTQGQVSVTLVVDAERGTPLAIDVEDSGAGIEPTLQPRLFAPFEATGSHTISSIHGGRGTGLGLALAHALCELIGCALSLAHSEPGHGSTFRIALPVPSRNARLAAEFLIPGNPSLSGNAEPGSIVLTSV